MKMANVFSFREIHCITFGNNRLNQMDVQYLLGFFFMYKFNHKLESSDNGTNIFILFLSKYVYLLGCEPLSTPMNGDLSQTGRQLGDTATVTCDRGYELTGSGFRTCHASGWDGTAADCVPACK